MPLRVRLRPLVTTIGMALVLAACGSGARVIEQQAPTSAQRLAAAIEQIAVNVRKPAPAIETAIKSKMANASIDDLAIQAEKTAQETAAFRRAAEQAAVEAERAATIEAVHDAACDALAIIDQMSDYSIDDQQQAFAEAIVSRLQEHRLEASSGKIDEIWDAVETQFDSISTTGTIDLDQAAIDFACLV